MPHFVDLIDLAGERVGGAVLWANDEFFAPRENLLKASRPVFLPDEYTDRGKWMDGWETRRKRVPGHDTCLVRLGLPGIVRGVDVDTSFFRGNYPEACSIEGCAAPADASVEALEAADWVELLPRSPLLGDMRNLFPIHDGRRVTHLRLHIYPDGGVARLRVHGEVAPDWAALLASPEPVDLAAAASGGLTLVASDMFFGSHVNLILPGRARSMAEGWETKRRRGPGHDWVILRLGARGTVERVEIDTGHFKGNYPDRASLELCDTPEANLEQLQDAKHPWRVVLPETKLEADRVHAFDVRGAGPATHARLRIYPDGGVSRLRLWGRPVR